MSSAGKAAKGSCTATVILSVVLLIATRPCLRANGPAMPFVTTSRSRTGARKVTFSGVPLDLGAGRRGVDMGPSAFRVADIHARVRALGYEVADRGDIEVFIQETHDPGDPHMKYLKEIRHTCEAVRDAVDGVLGQGGLPVVLGGDHSIAMGTI